MPDVALLKLFLMPRFASGSGGGPSRCGTMLLSATVGLLLTSHLAASESVKTADLQSARLLATAELLKTVQPASDNYRVKVFSYLDERACDGDDKCNGLGVFVTFVGDGELPDVAAKSVCCFSRLQPPTTKKVPNSVERTEPARLQLRVETSGVARLLEVQIQYRGGDLAIEYRLDGSPIDLRKR